MSERLGHVGNLRKIPVVLTDSRGRNLEEQVDSSRHPENKIVWWYRRGKGAEEQFAWLKENLQPQFEHLQSNHLTIYIWLGTCDLTSKSGTFIDIRSESYTSVNQLCSFYKQIYDYLSQYPTISLIFLELPYYSIYQWNKQHDHPAPEPFREKDRILQDQIYETNKYIRSLNSLMHQNSPDFSLDLEKSRKPQNKRCAKYSLNFGLYLDGVHPHPDLARLWLIRICLRLENDCN